MSRRGSLVRQPTQTEETASKTKIPAASPRLVPKRTSSSASTSSLTLPRLLSLSSWVFNQDYWRGSQMPFKVVANTKGPAVVVIRHAQALHNVKQATPELQEKMRHTRDTSLTSEGIRQAMSIPTRYPGLVKLMQQRGERVLVISTPLMRTLQTAYTGFSFLKAGQVVIAPDLQEAPDHAYDIGSAPEDLVKKLNTIFQVDGRVFSASHFASLSPDWFKKEGPYAFDAEAVLKRGRKIRRYIRSLDMDLVVVVTHMGIMPGFCEDRLYEHPADGHGWQNAEARAYTFDPTDTSGAAKLSRMSASENAAVLGARRPFIARTLSKSSM